MRPALGQKSKRKLKAFAATVKETMKLLNALGTDVPLRNSRIVTLMKSEANF